jgi:hypothetical protein
MEIPNDRMIEIRAKAQMHFATNYTPACVAQSGRDLHKLNLLHKFIQRAV